LPVTFQTKIVFRSDFCQYRLSFVFLPIDKITLHVHAAKISLAAIVVSLRKPLVLLLLRLEVFGDRCVTRYVDGYCLLSAGSQALAS